jgi:hypothetical protein
MNIDAEIAEKLFGFKRAPCADYSSYGIYVIDILEALRKKGFEVEITYITTDDKPDVYVDIQHLSGNTTYCAEEETLPLALCKAAIKALESK